MNNSTTSSSGFFVDLCITRLGTLLSTHFNAYQPDFTEKVSAIADDLPEELSELLTKIATRRLLLKQDSDQDITKLAEFSFDCGQLYEKLEEYRRMEMEVENVRQGSFSVSPSPLQSAQVEKLSRFIEVRDRLFRKVADFTLKAILVGLGLLILGLFLGIV